LGRDHGTRPLKPGFQIRELDENRRIVQIRFNVADALRRTEKMIEPVIAPNHSIGNLSMKPIGIGDRLLLAMRGNGDRQQKWNNPEFLQPTSLL